MAPTTRDVGDKGQRTSIVFDVSKRELFSTQNGFKQLNKKLRSNWKIVSNKDEITEEKLSSAKVFVIAGPRDKFTAPEFEAIKKYMENGGRSWSWSEKGGETKFDTNINFSPEEFALWSTNGKLCFDLFIALLDVFKF
nr:intraflagellar transport protein 52 homolog [Lytechinus pictus]